MDVLIDGQRVKDRKRLLSEKKKENQSENKPKNQRNKDEIENTRK